MTENRIKRWNADFHRISLNPMGVRRRLLVLMSLILVACSWRSGFSQSPARVGETLSKLHDWVGSDDNGSAWKRYLRSATLEAELARGAEADPQVIGEVLAQYKSGANGLDRPRFVAVRDALEAWLETLRYRSLSSLRKEVESAKESFQPFDSAQLEQARAALGTAINELDQLLANGPPENAEAWKNYLRWQQMQEQVSQDTIDPTILQQVLDRYRDDHRGLELPQYVAVREALLSVLQAQYFASRPQLRDEYTQQLDQLLAGTSSLQQSPTSDHGAQLGQTLGWLSAAGQAPDLVQGLRGVYTHPNFVARVSKQLVARSFDREVTDTQPVREMILGTNIRGTAWTQGRVFLDLVPNREAAAFDIRLSAVTTSRNVGYEQSVSVYSDGYTTADGRKRVVVDENGVTDFPAQVQCRTTSTVRGINAPIIINLFAPSQVARKKPATERVSARRAEDRFEQRMEEESAARLAEANQRYHEDFKAPLVRRRSFPEQIRFSTTANSVLVHLLKADPFQLGAPSPPPVEFLDNDISMEVHQSLIGNVFESAFGNDRLTDEDAAEIIEQIVGEVPEELRIGPDSDPWAITFQSTQPVSAEFSNGQVTLSIRLRSVSRGEQDIRRAMQATAVYDCLTTPEGIQLIRQGDVQADYTRPGRQSASQIAIKTFIRRKIAALLPADINLNELPLPTTLERLGELQSRQIRCEDGWLAVGWDQAQVAPVTGDESDGGSNTTNSE